MQPYGDNFIPAIPVEDDPIHTSDHPFCFDDRCACREDQMLVSEIAQQVTDGLLTPTEATNIFHAKNI